MPLGNPNAPADVARIESAVDVTIGWDAASILEIKMTATGKRVTLPGDPTKPAVGARPGRGSTETGKVTSTDASVVKPREGINTMRRGKVLIFNDGTNAFSINHDYIYGRTTDIATAAKKAHEFTWVPGEKIASDSKQTGYWIQSNADFQYKT